MKNINSFREKIRVETKPSGNYVLYWMQINRRLHYNHALDYAVSWANKLRQPLIILEGLACDYPWATARTSRFVLQGMAEHVRQLRSLENVIYVPFPEKKEKTYEFLVHQLCLNASLLISDEYPVFIMRERNESLEKSIGIPFYTVDSNGIIPMALSLKAPYSAYVFRRLMQEKFRECYDHPPEASPLLKLGFFGKPSLPSEIEGMCRDGMKSLESSAAIEMFISGVSSLDRSIQPLKIEGTREAGLNRLHQFLSHDLLHYEADRNDPDKERTSRLSPWLHFGKISVFEILREVFQRQPEDWSLEMLRPRSGKRRGFFGGDSSIEAFLDEIVTWRETGFHFAYHTPGYDRFDSLPDWARDTLEQHRSDPRRWIYSYEQLASARTHDPLWNAAQIQLREEGRIHNYLRMLWGKKILEWTPDPRTALRYLIDLNNYYAIDGRDPNSYSGIFWIFGRFDRAWGPERPIFGKIRYMSSESAQKKVKLSQYLKRYSGIETL